jgi:prepilin-type N-terminal cleavage/methylation domain-containing protein
MRRHTTPHTANAGMTLVEIMVALVILTVSTFMLSSTITSAVSHSEIKRERALAVEAAMNTLESMRAYPFSEIFAQFNATPDDDPDGVGTGPGMHFAAPGLKVLDDDLDGFCGRILLPSETDLLYENVEILDLGLPRDLDGDLQVDEDEHSADYLILPAKVFVEWEGAGGRRVFEMSTQFSAFRKDDD